MHIFVLSDYHISAKLRFIFSVDGCYLLVVRTVGDVERSEITEITSQHALDYTMPGALAFKQEY